MLYLLLLNTRNILYKKISLKTLVNYVYVVTCTTSTFTSFIHTQTHILFISCLNKTSLPCKQYERGPVTLIRKYFLYLCTHCTFINYTSLPFCMYVCVCVTVAFFFAGSRKGKPSLF